MEDKNNLSRFVEAQSYSYAIALEELREGRKTTHWIWYIFPQLKGLGHSFKSQFYGIEGIGEALAYVNHPVLGARLREVCIAILKLPTSDARNIFGAIDSRKLRSSMTLFDAVMPGDIFADVLTKFFDGEKDNLTLNKLKIIHS